MHSDYALLEKHLYAQNIDIYLSNGKLGHKKFLLPFLNICNEMENEII